MVAVAAAGLLIGCADIYGSVIGRSQPAESLTAERIHALPAAQRGRWLAYLRRSQQQELADRAALAAERKGLITIPSEPELSSSARSMPLDRAAAWYGSAEARHIADVIVSFQIPSGGWSKNLNMAGRPRQRGESYASDNLNRFASPGDLDEPRDAEWHYVGTLDNDATTTEMRFLAKVQASIPKGEGGAYRESFLRGVRYLLRSQYPNGGWPQVWPLEGGYHDAITFNDDATTNVAAVLAQVAEEVGEVSFVPQALRAEAAKAVAAANQCILAAQVEVQGRKTVWAQQIDPLSLQPVAARNFEPAALSSEESAHVLTYLMALPRPSGAVKQAVSSGVEWLKSHGIYDVAVVGGRETPEGRHVVRQVGAGPLWARYYSLETEQPIFGDRDKTIHDSMNELSRERRNGYAWYVRDPEEAIGAYGKWSGAAGQFGRQGATAVLTGSE